MPHLQRAFQLHNRLQGLEPKRDTIAHVFDQLQQGVVLLDAKGNMLLVNLAASAIFASEKALRLTPQGLVASIPFENSQLNALVQGAINTGNGNGLHSGGAIAITRDGLRPSLQVLVTPLRTKMVHLGKNVPVALIFVSDPERKPLSDSAMLAQLFGLTPAECRLAMSLAVGDSLKDAAGCSGLRQSTLRSQLKSIFAKTNTKRQSELIRLLLLAPSRSVRTGTTAMPNRE